jgi:hypothetical protein
LDFPNVNKSQIGLDIGLVQFEPVSFVVHPLFGPCEHCRCRPHAAVRIERELDKRELVLIRKPPKLLANLLLERDVVLDLFQSGSEVRFEVLGFLVRPVIFHLDVKKWLEIQNGQAHRCTLLVSSKHLDKVFRLGLAVIIHNLHILGMPRQGLKHDGFGHDDYYYYVLFLYTMLFNFLFIAPVQKSIDKIEANKNVTFYRNICCICHDGDSFNVPDEALW